MSEGQKIEISTTVRQAIENAWQAIGYDAYELARTCGEDLSNEVAIELVIDAGRIRTYGGSSEAADEVDALIKEHGYDAVHAALVQSVSLA